MKILKLSFLVLFAFLISHSISNAQELLVAAAESCVQEQDPMGSTDSILYRVNPDTFAYHAIGPIGFRAVTGLAQLADGTLVGTARADANGDRISVLIEINPFNGNGKLIGTIGNDNEGGCGRVPGLTYDPATDTLYGIGFRCEPGGHGNPTLLTINQNTGAGTQIGETGFFGGGNALSITSDGRLIVLSCCNPSIAYEVNPNTGQGTLLSQLAPDFPPLYSSSDFNPATGELFATSNSFEFTYTLDIVDPFTGQFTTVAGLPDCTDGILFFEERVRPIPTLSEWGLIAMAGILGIIGLFAISRRKATT